MRAFIAVVVAVALLAGASRGALAESCGAEARAQALVLESENRGYHAARLLEEARNGCADPELLLQLAQTYERVGWLGLAVEAYREWLLDPSVDPVQRARVEARILALEQVITPREAPASPRSGPQWYDDGWGWTLVGLGSAIGLMGGLMYLSSLSPEMDSMVTAEDYRGGGNVCFAMGGALILGGILRLAMRTEGEDKLPFAVHVSPSTVGMAWTF